MGRFANLSSMTSLFVSVRKVRFGTSEGAYPGVPPSMYPGAAPITLALGLGMGGLLLLSSIFCLSEYSGVAGGGAPGEIGVRETMMPGELSSLFA